MIVHPESDNPDRFAAGSVVDADGIGPLTIRRSQPAARGLMVLFEGVPDRTAAERLRGVELSIPPEGRRRLEDDEYWPDQIEGCAVVTDAGRSVGTVVEVVEGAAQYRLVVDWSGTRFEVPFVRDLVTSVDVEGSTVTIVDMPGLVPDAG